MLIVKDIMQTDVVTITADATARDLARILADEQVSGVPVRMVSVGPAREQYFLMG